MSLESSCRSISDIHPSCPQVVGQASEVLISVLTLHGWCGTSVGHLVREFTWILVSALTSPHHLSTMWCPLCLQFLRLAGCKVRTLWHCSGLVALACAVPVLLGRVAAAWLAGESHLVTLLWRLYMSRLSIFNSNPVGFLDHDILTLRFWLLLRFIQVHCHSIPSWVLALY